MILEVFASGGETGAAFERAVRQAVDDIGLTAETTIYRIEDPALMVGRGVWRSPGLAVDGKVVLRGKAMSGAELRALIASRVTPVRG